MLKHCDVDCLSVLENSVPPAELNSVSVFRASVQRYESRPDFQKTANHRIILKS